MRGIKGQNAEQWLHKCQAAALTRNLLQRDNQGFFRNFGAGSGIHAEYEQVHKVGIAVNAVICPCRTSFAR
ncbi:hypothetical protein [Ensifer aridi]|uniref:hypothetical protein n=1 Tax=Ensifer aridi TaxID=1708715 RepID=UPI00111BDDAE|nr:hypothetical protein [Ensifer aridi]